MHEFAEFHDLVLCPKPVELIHVVGYKADVPSVLGC
jgi:hypothetical protein